MNRLFTTLTIAISFGIYFALLSVGAQDTQSLSFEVIEPKVYRNYQPGQIYTEKFIVRNFLPESQTFVVGKVGMTVASDQGSPAYYEVKEADTFELANWITLPELLIEVPGNSSYDYIITVNVPDEVSPGGNYAALLFKSTTITQLQTGIGSVQSIAAQIVSTVPGDYVLDLDLVSFEADKKYYWDKDPKINIETLLANKGNVHAIPAGAINISGSRVNKTIVFNQGQGAVFPNAPDRKYLNEIEIKSDGLIPAFGKYNIDLIANYGAPNDTLTASYTVWILPLKFLAICLLAVLLTGLILWRVYVSFKK